jgi:cell division protein FtsW (lipid II flippase)
MFERRLYHHIDWAMVGAIVALCLIGLAQIYSTTSPAGGGASGIFFTQIWGILLGLVALAIVLGFDYRSLGPTSRTSVRRHRGVARRRAHLRCGAWRVAALDRSGAP